MRWKQFFTPVKSWGADEAKAYMNQTASDAFTLLDVRQAEEYESGHIPGAKWIPLPELGSRLCNKRGRPCVYALHWKKMLCCGYIMPRRARIDA